MRKLILILLAAVLLAAQSSAQRVVAPAEAAGQQQPILALNTQSPTALDSTRTVPNWETDVLAPLRAEQAAQNAAQTAKRVVYKVAAATGDAFARLRFCESGGDYTRNTGNGFYGAYQYDLGTWANYQGYARPDLAPAAVQDAKARITQAARGWNPWPACSLRIGLR
jgi:hypothetical protein